MTRADAIDECAIRGATAEKDVLSVVEGEAVSFDGCGEPAEVGTSLEQRYLGSCVGESRATQRCPRALHR